MNFPVARPRRVRGHQGLRKMVQETTVSANDLIYPFFIIEGKGIKEEIPSMPGNYRWSVDTLSELINSIQEAGVPGVMVFGIPAHKDCMGTEAYSHEGIVPQGVREIKRLAPELVVFTDVCLCEYTDHGHCGVVEGEKILNDPTLELLAKTAVAHAKAGADVVAPSDMMDGRVGAIRQALDQEGFIDLPILSYAAKYASAYYGPFRQAADSAPKFGDRRSYQMDPANRREAIREIQLDLEEGADMVMVKPGVAYLDVLAMAREFVNVPLATYQVSGEFAMIKAAALQGWIDERRIVMETMLAFKRAGADMILTYYAKEVANWLKEG